MSVVLGHYVALPMLHVEEVPLKIALPLPNFNTLPPFLMLELVGYALMLSLIDVIEQVTSNSAIEKLDPLGRPANTNNSLLAIWMIGQIFTEAKTNKRSFRAKQAGKLYARFR